MERRVISEIDYLQLQQREAELEGEIEAVLLSIPRLESIIKEVERKIAQSGLDFRNSSKRELSEVLGEISRIIEAQAGLKDRVQRTILRSPVNGTIKRLYINTIGGVVRPGMEVFEVVPIEDEILIEVEIKPADIANIIEGQLARIKFSAYDFSIHGSLSGYVEFISADTITDEEGNSFYLVRVSPERNYLGHESVPLPIRVGMTSEVDIITSKKTILQYLLKPIYRGLHNSLGEQ
jgi:membrane fusion protein, adhesin transport system